MEVTFTPSQQAIGAGRSSITVALTSATSAGQEPQHIDFQLPVSWYQSVPVNLATFSLTLVLLVAASVLLMGFAVWLAMFLTTKFTTRLLRHTHCPVRITGSGWSVVPAASRLDEPHSRRAAPTRLDQDQVLFDQLRPLQVRNPRRITVEDVTLQAYVPLLPGDSPRFTAHVPSTHLIESNSAEVALSGGHRVPVTPGLGLLLIVTTSIDDVAASTPGGPLRATLHLFTTSDITPHHHQPGPRPPRLGQLPQELAEETYTEPGRGNHRSPPAPTSSTSRRTTMTKMHPLLFLGLGGTGGKVLGVIQNTLARRLRATGIDAIPSGIQFLHIDVPAQRDAEEGGYSFSLSPDDYHPLTVPSSSYSTSHRDISRALVPGSEAEKSFRRWAPPPGSLNDASGEGARQLRAYGRVVALGQLPRISQAIRARLAACIQGRDQLNPAAEALGVAGLDQPGLKPLVIVLGSLTGGSGAGLIGDVLDVLHSLQGEHAHNTITSLFSPDVYTGNGAGSPGLDPNALTTI